MDVTIQVEAVVLAGGRSLRMGTNKALLQVDGRPLIVRICEALGAFCSRTTVVVADVRRHLYADVLDGLKSSVRFVGDAYPGFGPLAGLHAGLAAADEEWVFATACDMPFFSASLFEKMRFAAASASEETDAVVCEGQPFFALYRRRCSRTAERLLKRGERRMAVFVGELRTVGVGVDDEEKMCFLNLNTPEDYEAFHSSFKRS